MNQFFAYKTKAHKFWLKVFCNIELTTSLLTALINFLNLIKESKAAAHLVFFRI